MSRPAVYAAIDLGAESGRVVCGRLAGGRVELEEANRFPNRPVRLPDGLRWNLGSDRYRNWQRTQLAQH